MNPVIIEYFIQQSRHMHACDVETFLKEIVFLSRKGVEQPVR